jgi:hypothetical protein
MERCKCCRAPAWSPAAAAVRASWYSALAVAREGASSHERNSARSKAAAVASGNAARVVGAPGQRTPANLPAGGAARGRSAGGAPGTKELAGTRLSGLAGVAGAPA